MVKPFQALLLRGYSRAIITAHVPGARMWQSPGPGTNSKMFMFRVKHCLREIATAEIREKYCGERSTRKSRMSVH